MEKLNDQMLTIYSLSIYWVKQIPTLVC